jgi:hypothetical protein
MAAQGSSLPPRPTALPVEPDGIPDELKDLKQFVGWRYEPRSGDWTKVPYTVDDEGKLAHASNQAAEAVALLTAYAERLNAIPVGRAVVSFAQGRVKVEIAESLPSLRLDPLSPAADRA